MLKEEILERLESQGYDIKNVDISRNKIKGVETIQITAKFKDADVTYSITTNFAKDLKLTGSHIGQVLVSEIKHFFSTKDK